MDDWNPTDTPADPARRTLLGGAALSAPAYRSGGARRRRRTRHCRAAAIELVRHGADVSLVDIADPDAIPALASREELNACRSGRLTA